MKKIKNNLKKTLEIKNKINLDLINLEKKINLVVNVIYKKLIQKGKIFLCGNGGSAADAQHLAAEFLVRLRPKINRHSIPAISLAMDTSTITACANDYDFKYLFSRNLSALGSKKDILIAISTSGNSENIIEVLKYAKKNKIFSVGFLGKTGGKAIKYCDINLKVNSNIVARVQEAHIFLGHYIFEQVENKILMKNKS